MLGLIVKTSSLDDVGLVSKILRIRKICTFSLGFQIFSGSQSYTPLHAVHWSIAILRFVRSTWAICYMCMLKVVCKFFRHCDSIYATLRLKRSPDRRQFCFISPCGTGLRASLHSVIGHSGVTDTAVFGPSHWKCIRAKAWCLLL